MSDTRGPTLMQVMSHIIFLQRKNHMEPVCIVVSKEVSTVLSEYMKTGASIDRLYGVDIITSESVTALPFVVLLSAKPSRLGKI